LGLYSAAGGEIIIGATEVSPLIFETQTCKTPPKKIQLKKYLRSFKSLLLTSCSWLKQRIRKFVLVKWKLMGS
jgi:hypothetical protein